MLEKDTSLIVDRSPDVRQYVASVLQRQFGCRHVLLASNVDEALACLRSGTELIDWIFYEWDLPGIEPESFLAEVRKHPGSQGAAVLIMTRHRDKFLLDRALDAGGTDYLIKPFTLSILLLKVRKIGFSRERRSGERLRVHASQEIKLQFEDEAPIGASLISVSPTGCLVRLPVSSQPRARIYDDARLNLQTGDGIVTLNAQLVRLEADRGPDPSDRHVLAAFRLGALPNEDHGRLLRFIETLGPPLPPGWS